MTEDLISIGVAGPMQVIVREYGASIPTDEFSVSFLQGNWDYLTRDQLVNSEPDLLVLYAEIAPTPDDLTKMLGRLKKSIVIVLLPGSWQGMQGALEQFDRVGRVFFLPAAPAEVLRTGRNLVKTERTRLGNAAPLQQLYSGGRTAAAVGTRVIAFVSAQGGTGRSTIAEALAYELAMVRHIRTLLFSFDLPSPAPLRLKMRYNPSAGEFFARPETGFRDALQSKEGVLDVIIAPSDSYAYARAAQVPPDQPNSIRSLVLAAYMQGYGAILMDLPAGEGPWMIQPLLASNTVVVVSRPTLDGIKAVGHLSDLITNKLASEHRISKEMMFTVLNQRTDKTAFTASQFVQEGTATYSWVPPVLATIDYDRKITQAQDASRPASTVSDTLQKGVRVLADSFYGSTASVDAAPGSKRSRGGFGFGGLRIRVNG